MDTYTRYSDTEFYTQKKKLSVFNGSFLWSLVGGSHTFFNLYEPFKKRLGNPVPE